MKKAAHQAVSTIMTKEVKVLNTSDSLEKAERMFTNSHIRHLPVLEDHKLVGMLSWTDLKRLEFGDTYASNDVEVDDAVLNMLTIEMVMKTKPHVLDANQSIAEAANKLIEEEFHALPVTENEKLVGIVTTTDVIKYLLENQG